LAVEHSPSHCLIQRESELNTSLKTSFVVVTHDLELADKLGKIAYLDDGKLAIKESQHVA